MKLIEIEFFSTTMIINAIVNLGWNEKLEGLEQILVLVVEF